MLIFKVTSTRRKANRIRWIRGLLGVFPLSNVRFVKNNPIGGGGGRISQGWLSQFRCFDIEGACLDISLWPDFLFTKSRSDFSDRGSNI